CRTRARCRRRTGKVETMSDGMRDYYKYVKELEACLASKCAKNAVLVKALRRLAIIERERMAEGGKFAHNGYMCALCKSDWHITEAHKADCALTHIDSRASALAGIVSAAEEVAALPLQAGEFTRLRKALAAWKGE